MSDVKASRMVVDRVAITNTVLAAIDVHGPEIAPDLEKALFPTGTPKDLSVAALIAALGDLLKRRADTLVDADVAHATELADDDAYRTLREERNAETREFLSTLRSTLIRNYGQPIAGAYGLGAPIPDDPATVVVLARTVETLLRSRPLTETAKNKFLNVDPKAAADALAVMAASLQATLGDIDREKREAQITQNAKNEAMTVWGTTYSGVADATAAFFVLAGRPGLAERVRPTARRRAGMPEAEDLPEGEEGAEGSPT